MYLYKTVTSTRFSIRNDNLITFDVFLQEDNNSIELKMTI